jgi:hypothetical protein
MSLVHLTPEKLKKLNRKEKEELAGDDNLSPADLHQILTHCRSKNLKRIIASNLNIDAYLGCRLILEGFVEEVLENPTTQFLITFTPGELNVPIKDFERTLFINRNESELTLYLKKHYEVYTGSKTLLPREYFNSISFCKTIALGVRKHEYSHQNKITIIKAILEANNQEDIKKYLISDWKIHELINSVFKKDSLVSFSPSFHFDFILKIYGLEVIDELKLVDFLNNSEQYGSYSCCKTFLNQAFRKLSINNANFSTDNCPSREVASTLILKLKQKYYNHILRINSHYNLTPLLEYSLLKARKLRSEKINGYKSLDKVIRRLEKTLY